MGSGISKLLGLFFEPFVTGPLLLLLLRGPDSVRDNVANAVANYKLSGQQVLTLPRIITALKWLVALGSVTRVNNTLSHLSVNNWSFFKKGAPWDFTNYKETILITGGCSGFGRLIAERFAGKAKVVILDVSPLPKEMESIPQLHYYKCDVTKADEVRQVANKVKSEVGNPTVLLNNAGIGGSAFILDSDVAFVEKVFKVNIISHWTTVQCFLPGMLEMKKGHILTIASMGSFVTVGSIVDYCSTKSACIAFHEGLSAECQYRYKNGDCIQTSIIHPSWASTGIIKGEEDKLKKAGQRIMKPEIVADAIVKQIKSGKSGRCIIPPQIAGVARIRGWPMWMQQLLRGFINRNAKHFEPPPTKRA